MREEEELRKYDRILYMPHHKSQTRPPMPMDDRAAQFAPFATLRGYDEEIRKAQGKEDE